MEGIVKVDGKIIDKAGTLINQESEISIIKDPCPYVGRGGFKLEKAIKTFSIELCGKTCIDMGASTGGFTDCMLQNNAKHVYSIDVGYGQLAWKLRTDDRVTNIERTNIRYLDKSIIKEPADIISIDVSFISLQLILPIAKDLLSTRGKIISLIKPQFEAGREQVGKNGIIKDPKIHIQVIKKIVDFAASIGLGSSGLDYSPVKGAKGNIEYLLLMELRENNITDLDIDEVVKASHNELE